MLSDCQGVGEAILLTGPTLAIDRMEFLSSETASGNSPRIFYQMSDLPSYDSNSFRQPKNFMIDQDTFLRQEVESASPAKLRWLLLQKAHGLTLIIRDQWQQGREFEARQWVILIQDIFTELLAGVVDPKHKLAQQQSDLYVFLSKLIVLADQSQDIAALDSIREILEIEKNTWDMFVRREMATSTVIPNDDVYTPFSIEA